MSNFRKTPRTRVRRLAKRGVYDRDTVYAILDEALICQSGTCSGCDTDIRSWSKRAECPVCGQAVACT